MRTARISQNVRSHRLKRNGGGRKKFAPRAVSVRGVKPDANFKELGGNRFDARGEARDFPRNRRLVGDGLGHRAMKLGLSRAQRGGGGGLVASGDRLFDLDRKSTRLNSSHSQI